MIDYAKNESLQMYIAIIFLTLALSGCSVFSPASGSKYGTSNQGIPLNQLDTSKLKLGMRKTEVANLIGYPPHINPFAPDTWTYTYTKNGKQEPESLVLIFNKQHKLVKIHHNSAETTK